jgi:hypothetical protein
MTRREVIDAIVKAANDKIDEFSPRSINGMKVKWTCEFAGVQFNTPIIKIRVQSHLLSTKYPLHIAKTFGVGFTEAIEWLQELTPITDQEDYMSAMILNTDAIVDYYSRKLTIVIERMFYDYLKQIRQYDKELEETNESIENDLSK